MSSQGEQAPVVSAVSTGGQEAGEFLSTIIKCYECGGKSDSPSHHLDRGTDVETVGRGMLAMSRCRIGGLGGKKHERSTRPLGQNLL